MTITDQISDMEIELLRLRNEHDSLTNSNALLQRQNELMQMDIMVLTTERDTAYRRATEVRLLIESMGKMALEGVKKMNDEHKPRTIVERQQHTSSALPPPEFLRN